MIDEFTSRTRRRRHRSEPVTAPRPALNVALLELADLERIAMEKLSGDSEYRRELQRIYRLADTFRTSWARTRAHSERLGREPDIDDARRTLSRVSALNAELRGLTGDACPAGCGIQISEMSHMKTKAPVLPKLAGALEKEAPLAPASPSPE